MWDLHGELNELRAAGLERRSRALEPLDAVTLRTPDGNALLAFCSNDYLGLSHAPEVAAAFRAGVDRGGVGSGAAHLVTGHRPEHEALEAELADWLGCDRALLFSTGYMANLGVIAAFLGRGDLVVQDRLNHASLLDAGLLSGARMQRYRHADAAHLAEYMQRAERRRLVVTDGVFSMDGDVAPLADLLETVRGNEGVLMVDDAHGLGVLGEQGRGSLAEVGLGQHDVPLVVGTLGKAFGTAGAFVAGPDEWIELLLQKARTYIYTTAPPPAVAAATRAALPLVRETGGRRQHLHALIRRFRDGAHALGLQLMPSRTAIQPVVVGDAAAAVAASDALERRGLLVTAIRPPTVPRGSARLRITLSAAHTEAQVDRLLDGLSAVRPALEGG
ncbi:8-amino-7-oxononanoate synthase [Aquisalimonas sp.]|uniref:8-amino-7-oxononanoate synthase n=1 Tax=unclassified Aquisalimonas TaxID=2644645 RepID=UPI0025BC6A36|nr:8-amino-7-oxononanoate synthase [Aquisalimonas sp.]